MVGAAIYPQRWREAIVELDSAESRLLALLFFSTSLLVPNVAILVGGFHGFFLTYLTWSSLISVAAPLLFRDGRGLLTTVRSVQLGLALVIGLSILGIFLGFDAIEPPPNIVSFLISLGLFAVQTLGVEVGRSALMSLTKNVYTRIALGAVGGVILGRTAPALLEYLSEIHGRPVLFLEDAIYSLTLSLIHELGGLGSGVVFRAVVDGYWMFSPLILTTTIPPVLRSTILVLAYYTLISIILAYTGGLRGTSEKLFEFSRMRRIARVLPEALTIVIALALLILALNRFVPLVIISGSMVPTLSIGDVVFIHATGATSIKVGDVVAYTMEDRQIVVHRVVYMGPDGVRVKGDANPEPDPFLVSYSEILGRVVFVIPRLGYIAIAFQTGGWFIYLLIAALLAPATVLACIRKLRSKSF